MHNEQPQDDHIPSQQPNLDQQAHDRWLASQSPEQLKLLAGNLANMTRSKVGSSATSSTPASSSNSGAAQVGSFTEKDEELARALGLL